MRRLGLRRLGRRRSDRLCRLDRHHRRRLLGVGTGIGRFEIDDVAQQNFGCGELVAPDDDGLEGQRALAEALDHRLAAGLDALGDGDFALAESSSTEPISRRYMRTGSSVRSLPSRVLDLLATAVPVFSASSVDLLFRGVGLGLFDLVLVDDVDAHVREHRHDVLDLLGGDFLRRQDRVQFFIGDVAALLGGLDQLLYGGIGKVEQRADQGLPRRGCAGFRLLGVLRSWSWLLPWWPSSCSAGPGMPAP